MKSTPSSKPGVPRSNRFPPCGKPPLLERVGLGEGIGRPRSRPRVLLVDDDVSVRESLHDLLVDEGYAVTCAGNGEEAIQLVNQWPIDLILLDLNMPVKNGWDTFEVLTNEHPFIPVIIATARPNQYFMALNAGAGALMEKPMDIPTLLHTMKTLLTESAERRLQRLVGQNPDFHFKASVANP